jgi:hypothetical protein
VRKRVEHEVAIRDRAALTVHPIEFRAARQPRWASARGPDVPRVAH